MIFTETDLTMTFSKFCSMTQDERQQVFELHHKLNKAKVDQSLTDMVWVLFVGGIPDPIDSNRDIFTFPDDDQLTAIGKKYDRPVFMYTANLPIESL